MYYLSKVHINEEKLPTFFLPAGRYKLAADFHGDGIAGGKGDVTFDVINVVSKKQQVT